MKIMLNILFISFLSVFLFPLSVCDNGYIEINNDCYFESDIDVIDYFIDNSPDLNMILDTNDNGVIEPLEFCSQTWSNGRLKTLDCYPIIINGSYNWIDISGQIPSFINSWNQIEALKMPYSNMVGIVPDEICDLDLDFSDINIFDLDGNELCPPYPECIEDYMGYQSNFGTGSCELGNCYDVGVTQITALEINGDNYVNSYTDNGNSVLLVTMKNNGPHCSTYPGLMVTADVIGTSFPTEQNQSSVWWWYAMFADDIYFLDMPFDISPFVPPETQITITAESVIMNCLDEGCFEDPYCHECPLTDPLSITLTVGDLFPSQMGDNNLDGDINILDVVLVVSFILDDSSIWSETENAIELYISDLNQDYNVDVLDIVALVDNILSINL